MTDYSQGKIYKIICWTTGEIYIGSTVESLYERLRKHTISNDLSSRNIINRGNYEIVLIEKYPCKTFGELRMREDYYYDQYDCVNINRPFISEKEKRQYKNELECIRRNLCKDTINKEKREKKYDCECGSVNVSHAHKARHNRSKKHQDYLENL